MTPPPDDFDPDAHPEIKRHRCLALGWFDDDPMPARCSRDWGHVGGHVAMTTHGFAGPAWGESSDETRREAAGALAGGEVALENHSHVVRPKWNDPTGDAA